MPSSWPELLVLMTTEQADAPLVRGSIRVTGPGEGWVAISGAMPVIAGERPFVDADMAPPPVRAWRQGRRLRLQEPDGRINLIADDETVWQWDAEHDTPAASPPDELHYLGAGTELLSPRHYADYLHSTDFTRPTGDVGTTTFLGRRAWTVELAPPAHKPHPLQLVIDAETGIVLQQRNDGFGTVYEWVEFVVGEPVPAGLFTWTGPSRSVADVRAEQDARHEADLAQRREWFAANVLAEPMSVEVPLVPMVHNHDEDGSFEASLGDWHLGMLARRPRSSAEWGLRWNGTPHRWSTAQWDWALAFPQDEPTPESVASLIARLSATDR